MNYEQLENELVTRLSAFTAVGITVIKTPENENERELPIPGKAQFTVMYAGSEYENVNSMAQISQTENVFISVLVESNALRGSFGIYNLTSLLKKAIIGFKPSNCNRIQAVKHHTLGSPEAVRKENVWQYQAVFKTNSLTVEDFEEDLSVILRKITFIDIPDGEVNVVPNPNNIIT